MATPATASTEVRLDDRYTAGEGRALMSGIQALVRLLIEQRQLDASRGLNTGVYVTRVSRLAARAAWTERSPGRARTWIRSGSCSSPASTRSWPRPR